MEHATEYADYKAEMAKYLLEDPVKVLTNDYTNIQLIGNGAYGHVCKATNSSGKEVAVKIGKGITLLREVAMYNLIGCSAHFATCPFIRAGVIQGNIFIEMELAKCALGFDSDHHPGGERGRDKLSIDEKVQLAWDLVSGVAHFHSRGLILGDLSSHNCLLTNKKRLWLADFGLVMPSWALHLSSRESVFVQCGMSFKEDMLKVAEVLFEIFFGASVEHDEILDRVEEIALYDDDDECVLECDLITKCIKAKDATCLVNDRIFRSAPLLSGSGNAEDEKTDWKRVEATFKSFETEECWLKAIGEFREDEDDYEEHDDDLCAVMYAIIAPGTVLPCPNPQVAIDWCAKIWQV